MSRAFDSVHPAVSLLYFGSVLGFGAVVMHPALLAVGFFGALCCAVTLLGRRETLRRLAWIAPVGLMALILNPAFNHRGVTILTYLPSGNPLTLESLAFGLASAWMLSSVLLWCACLSHVMTSDKVLYLFGRAAPSLSLLLSMTLRFIPRFRRQAQRIAQAQRGLFGPPRGLLDRVRAGAGTLSILLTWALENAVETADSMRARGYGLPERTAFSLYRLETRDKSLLLLLSALLALTAATAAWGGLKWTYYPALGGTLDWLTALSVCAYLSICLVPVCLERKEERIWSRLNI
ncbi:energy-coupling factor transporter transmembrane protein EcfT [Oscillibacter sp. MSJ-2]|uniref:Energy-coupling factor transporter transmembrane protein EcfT n=1 Tax=Dysosmobacter acutus TaxID=2841504 RepID=A0ABS6F6R6_9FIRM|nr:energy-coupling factor transporter transmembrane component T [Dysosmobacter acutus]MBU5625984.1 energy-coupling factor transporter transmembrane protein EcfT [Dysosmobacter acutus]